MPTPAEWYERSEQILREEMRGAGRDVLDLDEKALVIEGHADTDGHPERNWSTTDVFHDGCGFAWSVHDNTNPMTLRPFGCPTETTARQRWGR